MKEIIKSVGLGFFVSLPFIIFTAIISTGLHFFGDRFLVGSIFFIVAVGLLTTVVYNIKRLGFKEFIINTSYIVIFTTIILSILILPTYFFNISGLIFTGILLSLFFFYGIGQEFIMNKVLRGD